MRDVATATDLTLTLLLRWPSWGVFTAYAVVLIVTTSAYAYLIVLLMTTTLRTAILSAMMLGIMMLGTIMLETIIFRSAMILAIMLGRTTPAYAALVALLRRIAAIVMATLEFISLSLVISMVNIATLVTTISPVLVVATATITIICIVVGLVCTKDIMFFLCRYEALSIGYWVVIGSLWRRYFVGIYWGIIKVV